MSFRDFDKGISAQEILRRREMELENSDRDFHARIEELLSILRPRGEHLPSLEARYDLWKESQST
jgi:hypothetical protein